MWYMQILSSKERCIQGQGKVTPVVKTKKRAEQGGSNNNRYREMNSSRCAIGQALVRTLIVVKVEVVR